MSKSKIRILIADDHSVVRKGLAMVLRLEPDIEIVGEAGSGEQAVALTQQLQPNLVLLDRVMPGTDIKETILQIKEVAPDTWLLMLTGTELDSEVLKLLSAGVDGYVLKDIEPNELKLAIRTVASGEAYLQPAVTRHVVDSLAAREKASQQDLLTRREKEVLEWMATTLTYREIAKQLNISEETVRSHTKRVLSKLGQPNRATAVKEAIRLGILEER